MARKVQKSGQKVVSSAYRGKKCIHKIIQKQVRGQDTITGTIEAPKEPEAASNVTVTATAVASVQTEVLPLQLESRVSTLGVESDLAHKHNARIIYLKDLLKTGDKRHKEVKNEKAELESRNQELVSEVSNLTKRLESRDQPLAAQVTALKAELQSANDSVKFYQKEIGQLKTQLLDLRCVVPDNKCTYCFTYLSVTYGMCK